MNADYDPMGQAGGLAEEMQEAKAESDTEAAEHAEEEAEEKEMVLSTENAGNTEPEPVDGRMLLDELRETIRRFVVLPAHAAETLALWILHTYAFELRKVTTYIGVASPEKRCGKTTLLGVLTDLVSRPIGAANISPPALFRAIEENRPTLLIDEADTFLATNEELRGILNSGYNRKGAYVMRVGSKAVSNSPLYAPDEGDDWFEGETRPQAKDGSRLVRFSCWCPKVIAAIGRLPDTLADRCIVITMQRKRSDEQCERLRELEPVPLRQRCARFVRENEVKIGKARPEIPAALNDRAGDIWEPLFVLADLAGGDWPKRAREAAVHLSGTAQETSSAASLLFADIKLMFTVTGAQRLFSRDIVQVLNEVPDRPWKELRRGKALTEMWLAMQLRAYGIRPRTLWIGSEAAKGYEREDFEDAFSRYATGVQINHRVAENTEKEPGMPHTASAHSRIGVAFGSEDAKGAEGGQSANDANEGRYEI